MGVEDIEEINDCVSDEFFTLLTETAANNSEIYYNIFKAEPSDFQRTFKDLEADRKAFEETPMEEIQEIYDEQIGGVVGHVVDYPIHYMENESLALDSFDMHNLVPKINFT